MRPRIRQNFGTRARIYALVALVLIPALTLTVYRYRVGENFDRERALASQDQTADSVAMLLDASFDRLAAVAEVVAGDPAVRSLDPIAVAGVLGRIAPVVGPMVVFDGRGDAIAEEPEFRPRNIGDTPRFRSVIEANAPVVAPVLISPRTGRLVSGVLVPVHGLDGRPTGAAGVAFDFDEFARTLRGVDL